MIFSFSLKSALLLFFFAHGLVFTGLLGAQGRVQGRRAHYWLSMFLLLCCLYIAPFMLGYAGWYGKDGFREALFFLPLQQLLLIGPVFYFYTKSLLNPGFLLTRKEIIHFFPAVIYLFYTLFIFIADVFILNDYYFYADGKDKDLDPWYQIAGFISMFYYFALSLSLYEKYKKRAFEVLSFAEEVQYRWVQRFLITLLIILILRILFFILNPEWGEFGSKFWYYLCFSILFYYISITGYTHAVRVGSPFWGKNLDSSNALESLPDLDFDKTGNAPQQIPDLDHWKAQVEMLMREQALYTNAGLTLLEVAAALSTTPKQVSQIVNQGFAMNFNDFVNHYRILAMIEKFKAGEHETKTLLALALECGFNSKSTFNRAFKKQTGTTPKDYLENLAA